MLPARSSYWLVLLIMLIVCATKSVAQQTTNTESTLQEIIESNSAQNESENFEFDGYIDELESYKKHPINLNTVGADELSNLSFLTPQQVNSIIRHRANQGKFISIYELQGIPNLDLPTIQKMLPFVMVDNAINQPVVTARKLFSKGQTNLILRYKQQIEKPTGYLKTDGSGYLGKAYALYARFRYNYANRLSYGFTAEKDAGEEFFKGYNKQGFDYYSGHFFLQNFKALKYFAIGDYELRLGQGLIFWSGFGYRKSPAVMNVKREGPKLRPYTSVNEFNYLRGTAFTVAKKGFELTMFGSYKLIDGNVFSQADTLSANEEVISSFNESGFHRTEKENKSKFNTPVVQAGSNINYGVKNWHVGLNAVYTRFLKKYERNLSAYNIFDFNRTQLIQGSLDYHWLVKNIHFFGETALSDNLGYATINGMMISLDKRVDMSVVHRFYAHNYHSINANAFGESSKPQNENGIYMALTIKPISIIRIDVYSDFYNSKWLKYLTDAPSVGSDNFMQLTLIPNKKFEAYLRYKYEWRKRNETDNKTFTDYITNEHKHSLRFNTKYKVSEIFTLSNRLEYNMYSIGEQKAQNGFMVYQDVIFKKMGFPLSFNARLAIFKTDSYNNRIYTYENDILYSFSIPAYYGNGVRFYLTLNCDITRNMELWFRVARTEYFDNTSVGSGLDELPYAHKTEVKTQLRLKF